MVYTDTWNAAFEAVPADAENISQGADRIRDLKLAIRERLQHDHYMDPAGTDADHGEHELVTLRVQATWGSPGADKAYFGTKDVAAKAELHFKDEDDNLIQITSAGALNVSASIPSGTKMLFYADSAPSGWTLINTMNDKLVFVTKGSVAGGETGGDVHSTGTWTQPDHTLITAEIPAHLHALGQTMAGIAGDSIWYGGLWGAYSTYRYISDSLTETDTENTGGGGAHNHGTTWRPAAYNFIVCSKN